MDVTGRGEFAAIARLAARLSPAPPGQVWIGDDAAVLEGGLLFASDSVVAGVHADLELIGLDDLGWKAMAAGLSDVAAMGGLPTAAVVSVAGPPATDLDLLYEGIAAASAHWRCPVVGGDLSTAPVLVVAVAVLGDGSGEPPPVVRSGARAGDAVMVTGPLGSSAAGLRVLRHAPAAENPLVLAHRRPLARIEQGRAARAAGATAMIDVSDGLSADLGHLLDVSGVGVCLLEVPVAAGATRAEALGGGEDYELVFTISDPGAAGKAFARAGLPLPQVIGTCTADPAERTLDGDPLPMLGWEHPWR